jgi:hypothetical protein
MLRFFDCRYTTNMSLPRPSGPRQHTVPRFHLQPWASGRRKRQATLWQYDKADDSITEIGVREAGVIPGFYTIDGTVDHAGDIDAVLSVIENRAAPILKRVALTPAGPLKLTATDRWNLSLYLSTLNRRVPAAVTSMHREIEALRQQWLIDTLEDPVAFAEECRRSGRLSDTEEAERSRQYLLDRLKNKGDHVRASGPLGLAAIAGAPQEAVGIASRRWTVIVRPHSSDFLIADTAIKLLAAGARDLPIFDAGRRGLRWQVPLSPSAALIATDDDGDDAVVAADAGDPTLDLAWKEVLPDFVFGNAALFHGVTSWQTAERWVWARDPRDLERVGSGFSDTDRRRSGSELHRRIGFVRSDDPAHVRAVLDEARRRLAARAAPQGVALPG